MNKLYNEVYGMPMVNIYTDLDKIETENYILSKKSYRYPKHAIEFMRGGFIPGDYVVLYSKKRQCVVMSDTPMERYTNQDLIRKAQGDICILGLGIGMVLFYLFEEQAERDTDDFFENFDNEEETLAPIKSITVIEKDKELIDLIEPLVRNHTYFKNSGIELNIIHADAYEYPKTCDKHFDLVYADIWDEYHGYEDEADVFDELEALYSSICDDFDGWGYAASHGHNPDDESPIETRDYIEWIARMIHHYCDWDMISKEIMENITQYIECMA